MIGESVRVTVVDIRGDKCRIGVEAPKDVAVHRREVYDAIHRHDAPPVPFREEECGGVVDCMGHVTSDADPGL